jgi:hypothetical protein
MSPRDILPTQVKKASVTLPCVRVHVLALRWGLVRPYCDGASLLSCRATPTLRSVFLLLTMELANGRRKNVPIARLSARPESWQIVGKWIFEQETAKQKK